MAENNTRIALLAGATGLTGNLLLAELLADTRYSSVYALVRKSILSAQQKMTERLVDFEHLGNLPKIDDVFCCLGTTIKKAGSREAFRQVDFDYVLNLARTAKAAGALRFMVMSSIGANPKSDVFYSSVKGEMEAALAALGFAELHIFQPSFLVGDRTEKRVGERIGVMAFQLMSPLFIGPARKYRSIRAKQVAHAMVVAALSGMPGKHIYTSDMIELMC